MDFMSVAKGKVKVEELKLEPGKVEPIKTPPIPKPGTFDLEPAKLMVSQYTKQLKELEAAAKKFVVKDEKSAVEITELGARSAKLFKALEEDRKKRTEPERDYVRSTDALYKPLKEIIKAIKEICGQKHRQYRDKVRLDEKKRQKAAEEAQKKLQAQMDAEAKKAGVESVEVAPVVVEKAPEVTRSESGSAHTYKEWTWEEEDFSKVSDEFKVLNTTLINKQVRAGVRQIEGIKIFQIEKTRFRKT